ARTRPHGSDLVLDKPLEDDAFAAVLEQAASHIDGSENARRPMQAARSIPPVAPAQPAAAKAEFTAHPPSESAGVMDLAAAGDIVTAQVAMPEVAEPAQPAEPETRNVAEMLARRRIDQPVRVGELVIDPEHDAYYSAEAALKPLKPALENPCAAARVLDANALAETRKGKAQPLARLRWFAGLVATPGELAHGLATDSRYKLSRWPQTEREFPRHFRIATAMMKQAAVPAQIAQASGAPLADVIDYINASRAAGWLAVEHDEPAPAESEAQARGNVLSRFRKPFAR
ncbi:MAG: hypothetical protein JSS21_01800, partial [Proteobacteria bacterium]|nr:hypothetical protein [Pseudomonadota bacterium]